MDSATIGLLIFGALMLGGLYAISRYQARTYKTYLERHTEETQKVTENQRAILEITRTQTAQLTRIADALEKRP